MLRPMATTGRRTCAGGYRGRVSGCTSGRGRGCGCDESGPPPVQAVCYRPAMIGTLLPMLVVFGPAVAVGALLAVYGNDAAAAIAAAGVLLMTVAAVRALGFGSR